MSSATTPANKEKEREHGGYQPPLDEKKNTHQASPIADRDDHQPPRKKVRSTAGLENPTLINFMSLWQEGPFECLGTAGSLFGQQRSWFVRESYIDLYDKVMNDGGRKVQIINGTAGIGKSSFLMYILARTRSEKKPALLHYHRRPNEAPIDIFFPADGSAPEALAQTHRDHLTTVDKWYFEIDQAKSVYLVDGIVSFDNMDFPDVTYVAAKSPSCDIGWMGKSQRRRDRWLTVWEKTELLSYATQVDIPDAEKVINENFIHLGGVARHAFEPNAAEEAVNGAVRDAGATELFKLVQTGWSAKFDKPDFVDRLVHRRPPAGGVGVLGATFTFASEYVSKKVAMSLALESQIETKLLLEKFKTVGAAGGLRGVLFEAYAARKIADGGDFPVKQLGTQAETTLSLLKSSILQKDTKRLFKTELSGTLVWPNPDFNMPAIDMFKLEATTLMALQMTVSTSHTLDIAPTAFLRYFDSVCRELFPSNATPAQYQLYFCVPADVYNTFSKSIQPVTGPDRTVLSTTEGTDSSARISQWLMKVE